MHTIDSIDQPRVNNSAKRLFWTALDFISGSSHIERIDNFNKYKQYFEQYMHLYQPYVKRINDLKMDLEDARNRNAGVEISILERNLADEKKLTLRDLARLSPQDLLREYHTLRREIQKQTSEVESATRVIDILEKQIKKYRGMIQYYLSLKEAPSMGLVHQQLPIEEEALEYKLSYSERLPISMLSFEMPETIKKGFDISDINCAIRVEGEQKNIHVPLDQIQLSNGKGCVIDIPLNGKYFYWNARHQMFIRVARISIYFDIYYNKRFQIYANFGEINGSLDRLYTYKDIPEDYNFEGYRCESTEKPSDIDEEVFRLNGLIEENELEIKRHKNTVSKKTPKLQYAA